MAIIQYTAIVNQIRGKLNGSVFNKSHNGYTLQRAQNSRKGSSRAQSIIRQHFAQAQRAWRTLSQQERANVASIASKLPVSNRLGEQVYLNAYNHFVKTNALRLLANEPILKQFGTSIDVNVSFDIETASVSSIIDTEGNTTIEGGLSLLNYQNDNATNYIFVYISPPISPGVTVYHGRWHFMNSQRLLSNPMAPDARDLDFAPRIVSTYPSLSSSALVLMKIEIYNLNTGARLLNIITPTEIF